ncbi:MAG: hypothetical protein AAF828_02210 [Bacteroidota bacterium]
MHSVFPDVAVNIDFADLRRQADSRASLSDKIQFALEFYPCEVLFIHRDTESRSIDDRQEEIAKALKLVEHEIPQHIVSVIPMRMTEAWFLHDEDSIRLAAGNPNGKNKLNLPPVENVHRITNPKKLLEESLIKASGLNKRRLKSFKPRKQMHRLAEVIEDFSVLRSQQSFRLVENQLKTLRANIII